MRRTLVAVAGLGLLAALVILALRWTVESGYHTVSIVLDGPDWEATAAREGHDPAAIFRAAAARGATGVAVYEWTLKRLADHGRVAYASSEEIQSQAVAGAVAPAFGRILPGGELRPRAVYVAAGPETLGWLEAALRDLLGSQRIRRVGGLLEVRGLRDDIEQIGLGYLAQDLRLTQSLGLVPVLRLRNYAGLTEDGLHSKVARLVRLGGGHTVVFELTEVLGYDRLVRETGSAFKAAGFSYGRIEVFSERRRQRGDMQLAAQMRPHVIRLFSLTPEELLVLAPGEARDKFVRSARERNIRLLYVRPLTGGAGRSASEANVEFVGAIAADLQRFGLRPGHAEPLPGLAVTRPLLLVTAAGAVAILVLGLIFIGDAVGAPVPPFWAYVLTGAGIVLTAALLLAGPIVLWRKLLALGTASVTAALGVVFSLRRIGPSASRLGALWAGVQTLWVASAVSIGGGLLVAALLTSWDFMMASQVFLGVKVAHLIPVVLAAVLIGSSSRTPRSWRETAQALWEWSAHPLRMRYAMVAVLIGFAGIVLLARSGNFGLPVLAIEDRLRTITEDVLVARPRTKEYLIGHPALFLAGAAMAAGWRRWVLPLAAIGAVGQAGIINSFSHIHTPLVYTLLRTINALVLGTVFGVIGTWVVLAIATAATSPRRPS
ncbi:MAG TPA: DUF5693 family protein [bacterium]|nr:DUF5693 family protein [bacterium]